MLLICSFLGKRAFKIISVTYLVTVYGFERLTFEIDDIISYLDESFLSLFSYLSKKEFGSRGLPSPIFNSMILL